MAVLLVPSVLRGETAGAARLDVVASGDLRAVLDEVAARWPRLARRISDEQGALRRHVNIYLDGEECRLVGGLDAPVGTDTELQLLPSIAGG